MIFLTMLFIGMISKILNYMIKLKSLINVIKKEYKLCSDYYIRVKFLNNSYIYYREN